MNDEIRQRIALLPPIILPQDEVRPPNRAVPLHRGDFAIKQEGREVQLNGTITFSWLPSPEVRFEGSSSDHADLELEHGTLTTERGGISGKVLVLSAKPGDHGTTYGGIFQGVASVGHSRPVRRVDFELVNFTSYIGSAVRNGTGLTRARFTAVSRNWRLIVDQLPNYDERRRDVRQHGGFAVTHTGRLEKVDGSLISRREAQEQLDAAHFFLAFLAGQWVGPIRPQGFGKRTSPLWQQYASWKATPRVPRTWLPATSLIEVNTLFAEFADLWTSELWRRSLMALIYWYVQANAESGTSEAAAVAAFIPLEMLTWLVLVEDGKRLSRKKYKSLATGPRLEALLMACGIPAEVPAEYERLKLSKLYARHSTGPALLTAYRNALVHPTKSSRSVTRLLDSHAKYELRELALTYVELAVLSRLGYKGRYSRRVFSGWRGQEEALVPWCSTEEVTAKAGDANVT